MHIASIWIPGLEIRARARQGEGVRLDFSELGDTEAYRILCRHHHAVPTAATNGSGLERMESGEDGGAGGGEGGGGGGGGGLAMSPLHAGGLGNDINGINAHPQPGHTRVAPAT